MTRLSRFLAVALCLFVSSVSAELAAAQCGGAPGKVSWHNGAGRYAGSLLTAAYGVHEDDRRDNDRDADKLEPIVGLWKIAFVDASKGYTDTGYAAWHSDFTEFQNSARTPSTGAVCQGVWVKTGPRAYKLNHYALAYGDSVSLTNIIRIREEVVVDESGKRFKGTFVTDVYDMGHNLVVEFTGPITGKRVTIDSAIDSQ